VFLLKGTEILLFSSNNGSSCSVMLALVANRATLSLHSAMCYKEQSNSAFLQTLFQALVTPSEKQLEGNQNVQWRPGSWGPPLNLFIALRMFLKASYESLREGLQKQSYVVLNIHGGH
jgi:hypothetical protein